MVIAFGFVLGRALVWSCHPVPVDHSGDCIRVSCWDELQFGACLACFGCSVLSIFGFQISSLGFASSSLIYCSWGVLSFVCFWDYLCNKLDVPT